MNAEDGSEEPGIEENKNPDLDCEFENANDDAALSEGRYSTYKKVCQSHPEYLVMFCAKFKLSMFDFFEMPLVYTLDTKSVIYDHYSALI